MMYEKPKKLVWWRILAAMALVAVLAFGGYMLFNAGVAHEAAGDLAMLAFGPLSGAEGDLAMPMYGYKMPMRGYRSPGSFFFGLIFFFIVLGLIKKVIFGPRFAYRRFGMRGMGPMNWKEGAEKWHAELHDRMDTPESEPEADQPTDE